VRNFSVHEQQSSTSAARKITQSQNVAEVRSQVTLAHTARTLERRGIAVEVIGVNTNA
jgi:hypothetical protein